MTRLQLKKDRLKLGMSQSKYAQHRGIPLASLRNWEQGRRDVPDWLEKTIENEKELKLKNNQDAIF